MNLFGNNLLREALKKNKPKESLKNKLYINLGD